MKSTMGCSQQSSDVGNVIGQTVQVLQQTTCKKRKVIKGKLQDEKSLEDISTNHKVWTLFGA